MASLMSSATVAQASMVALAPISGLKSTSTFPVTRKAKGTNSRSSGLKVNCMQVWPPLGLKKFETLSYLPPLSEASLLKEIEYLIKNGWIPCIEFSVDGGFVYRENHRSPGYYDGRYWTMWKLPMYGCTDATQVAKEVDEAKKAYPQAFIRIIGFDNKRQVQCISFLCYDPQAK